MNKEYTQKFLITNVIILIILNLFNQIAVCNENYDDKQQKKYQSLYKKCNERYCQYLNALKPHPVSIQKKSNIYSSALNNNISEIQISNNSLNFKNIYLKNCNHLIFHQLGYHFTNKEKIYNFGLGYRHYYSHQWIIGNNIFYNTLLSRNNKKILSIGHEFLKNSIHITLNTYYNTSNNDIIYIQNKKFFPFYYDIYIKNRLPFFINTYSKINIEHYYNYNTHNTYLQNINKMIKKNHYLHNNTLKLTFGLSYTPTSIFTFNIDKTIFSSMKNYETKFNILANYKINIPWIYQKNNANNKQLNCPEIWITSNNEYAINRNHSILFKSENINFVKKTRKNYNKHTKTIIPQNESKKIYHIIQPSENEYTTNDQKNMLDNHKSHNLKNELPNNSTLSILQKSDINSKLSSQTQADLSNNIIDQQKNNHFININSDELPSSFTNNHHNNQTIIPLTDIHHDSNVSSFQKIPESSNFQIKLKELDNIHHTNNLNIPIPPPPPMFNFLKTINQNDHDSQTKNSQTHLINHGKSLKDLKYDIENIKKNKKSTFSSLGSEEHLLKLHNVSQKRKKTISISSNDSNDSESMRLLKMIERQSMLTTNNDTDSDDKDSTISNNEFSE